MSDEYFISCNEGGVFFEHHDNKYRIWLNKNIGRQNWQFYGAGSTHPLTLRFETREDALAFKLYFNLNN